MQKRKVLKYSFLIGILLALTALAVAATASAVTTVGPIVSNVQPADGGTVYTNGTSTITSISADYAPGSSGSPVDSSTVMVHLDGGNMLYSCPTQTDTHVTCNATVTDLYAGAHTLDIFVTDFAGNVTDNHTTLTVVVDNQTPTYSNLLPVSNSTILTSTLPSLLMEFDYSDPAPSSGVMPMIHVNDSHDGTSGAMIMGCTNNKTTAHYSCPAVKAQRLHLGNNWMEVLLSDKVGNNNFSLPSRMNYYTVVDDLAPTVNSITTSPTTITATYSDPEPAGRLAGSATLASGIDITNVNPEITPMIHVDGICINEIVTCSFDAAGISCPVPPGLAPGSHSINVYASDNAGNPGSGSGTLNMPCSGVAPALSMSTHALVPGGPQVEWATYADFTNRLLSVHYLVSNGAGADAHNVSIIDSVNLPKDVTVVTPLAVAVGDIAAGGSSPVTLQYHVPPTVDIFWTTTIASAKDSCGSTYQYP